MKTTNINTAFLQTRLLPTDGSQTESEHELAEKQAVLKYLSALGKPYCGQFQPASVLIPLVKKHTSAPWEIILTRRAEHLKHHAGEISFPGGRFETSDLNLQTTAIRETQEEIGVEKQQINIIGKLPKQNTISQYQVTPFVAIIDPSYQLIIDKNEVSEAFLVPLNFVLNSNNHKKKIRHINQHCFSYDVIQYHSYRIWGATARILVNLSKRLT